MKKFLIILIYVLMISDNAFGITMWDMKPQEVRDLINQKIFSVEAEKPAVEQVEDVSINRNGRTVPLRIYFPNSSQNLSIVLFIHGGGWVAGNLDTHDNMARYLCRGSKALVVSVGYTNSPEGKFPLPLEQCYDALLWTVQHAVEFHADAKRLAVVGDSAGGNMAAALCLLARDQKGPSITMQVLINPSPDLTGQGTLQSQGDAGDPLRWFAAQYVSDPKETTNPYVSPVLAKDLKDLPAAVIILAEKDDLFADGQEFAKRLISAGVPTEIYVQKGIGHLAGNGARASKLAQESLDVANASLRKAFENRKKQ